MLDRTARQATNGRCTPRMNRASSEARYTRVLPAGKGKERSKAAPEYVAPRNESDASE
jgi:hypothetical protein